MSPANAVIRAVETMTSAFHQGDLEGVMAAYEPHSTIVFEPGQPISDPQQQRAKFREFFAVAPRFTYAGHEVFLSGDTAVHLAPWTMKGTTPDGHELTQQGLSIAVLRRQPNGRWLMVIDDPHGGNLLSVR
ncbi:MAG: DUF4440 domain-containing protein [Kofleriaceae bacterium]